MLKVFLEGLLFFFFLLDLRGDNIFSSFAIFTYYLLSLVCLTSLDFFGFRSLLFDLLLLLLLLLFSMTISFLLFLLLGLSFIVPCIDIDFDVLPTISASLLLPFFAYFSFLKFQSIVFDSSDWCRKDFNLSIVFKSELALLPWYILFAPTFFFSGVFFKPSLTSAFLFFLRWYCQYLILSFN